ncbi:hypothetical protein D9758_013460 [Tetrapyrgos nigripes]|uniref:Uncharacterized protein n=1 Tax=Tetrapyrgos nigripes TaxID=182062 RepID=A0A8H5CS38_9AGAR|nr:hypothetical protein D9758_013460 [Tetrapyrgos nigripes]
MDATQINLHKVIGPMLIGAWLNLMLFVLVINQALYYFRHYPIDRILVKIAVFAVLVCDMGTIIAGCADAYLDAVTFQGWYMDRYLHHSFLNSIQENGN